MNNRMRSTLPIGLIIVGASVLIAARNSLVAAERFDGQYYQGEGDVEYLQLLDIARRMFEPDPEFQNMPMLYTPAWNGLVRSTFLYSMMRMSAWKDGLANLTFTLLVGAPTMFGA